MKLSFLFFSFFISFFSSLTFADPLEMGKKYFNDRDYEKSINEFLPLAKKNNIEAQLWLGIVYERIENYLEAHTWYEKSSNQGNAQATLNLAELYEFGLGVEENINKAISLYQMVSDKDVKESKDAQQYLTSIFAAGFGVKSDFKLANKYHMLAYENGHTQICDLLYSDLDFTQEKSWFLDYLIYSSKNDNIDSYFCLGELFRYGENIVPIDYEYSYMWLNIAQSKGHPRAEKSLKKTSQLMNNFQIADSQKLTRKCIEKSFRNCMTIY